MQRSTLIFTCLLMLTPWVQREVKGENHASFRRLELRSKEILPELECTLTLLADGRATLHAKGLRRPVLVKDFLWIPWTWGGIPVYEQVPPWVFHGQATDEELRAITRTARDEGRVIKVQERSAPTDLLAPLLALGRRIASARFMSLKARWYDHDATEYSPNRPERTLTITPGGDAAFQYGVVLRGVTRAAHLTSDELGAAVSAFFRTSSESGSFGTMERIVMDRVGGDRLFNLSAEISPRSVNFAPADYLVSNCPAPVADLERALRRAADRIESAALRDIAGVVRMERYDLSIAPSAGPAWRVRGIFERLLPKGQRVQVRALLDEKTGDAWVVQVLGTLREPGREPRQVVVTGTSGTRLRIQSAGRTEHVPAEYVVFAAPAEGLIGSLGR
jgi:hypothetical protein